MHAPTHPASHETFARRVRLGPGHRRRRRCAHKHGPGHRRRRAHKHGARAQEKERAARAQEKERA